MGSRGRSTLFILTRRPGEQTRVGDRVTISVAAGKGNIVRLGIEALREVAVHREETDKRIQREGPRDSRAEATPRP